MDSFVRDPLVAGSPSSSIHVHYPRTVSRSAALFLSVRSSLMITEQTSARTPADARPAAPTGDAARLHRLLSGPDGLSPAQVDALLAGWDPARSTIVAFLLDRGVLDRIGGQTLGAALKGYVMLRGADLCRLLKQRPRTTGSSSRESPHSAPNAPPSTFAASPPIVRAEAAHRRDGASPAAASPSPDTPDVPPFTRLPLRDQICALRAELAAAWSRARGER